MFSILNPSVQAVKVILAPSPLGQKFHSENLTNPLLTFFNYANLDGLRVGKFFKHTATAAV
jgi:hypothetical protein